MRYWSPTQNLVVGEPLDREVLAELPVAEIVAAEKFLPVAVGLDLVDEHGAIDAAMPAQVALPVTVDVEAANHPPSRDGILPDTRADRPSLPFDITRHADVDGQDPPSGTSYGHGFTAPFEVGRFARVPLSRIGRHVAPVDNPGRCPRNVVTIARTAEIFPRQYVRPAVRSGHRPARRPLRGMAVRYAGVLAEGSVPAG